MNTHADYDDRDIYEARTARCPLCGGSSLATHARIDRSAPPFSTDRCADCNFIFMNPRLTDTTIMSLYREDYYRGNAEYAYYDEREAERYARHVWDARLRVIRRHAPGGGPFLDVGAAFGGLLRRASRWYEPYGIEPSLYAGSHAQGEFGQHVHVGTLADHPFPQEFFSVITMIEVLEHIADPVRAVRECFRLLRPGGLAVIQTANMDGWQAKLKGDRYAYFLPGHLSYFTMRNLSWMLKREGFGDVRVFRPVEFGLLPKLLKSRYGFQSFWDYRRWWRISLYHFVSMLAAGNFSPTSSMVVYAKKT